MNKEQFLATASPTEIQARHPFEYTLQWRMGASKWHLSAVKMTELEIKMFKLASAVREFELDVKGMNVPLK